MKKIFEADTANELYRQLIRAVDQTPDYKASPRGLEVLEKVGTVAILTNPRECLIDLSARKLNYRYAAIEKLEYLWGKHDYERLTAYNSNLGWVKGELGYFDGNYAQRFNYWLDHIYLLLKKDPDSRQAVVNIYDSISRHQSSKDIPCTLTLQFLIREGKLNLITNMRSNDLLWGFPYDINAFCFIQEVMAKWLNVELGYYQHNVGSTHIYTKPEENYSTLMKTSNSWKQDGVKNPVWNLTYEETKEWLPKFFYREERLRRIKQDEPDYLPPCLQDYYDILKTKWIK